MEHFNIFIFVIYLSAVLCFKNVEARLRGEGIIGGHIATEGQFKYVVSVQSDDVPICGGVIFDDYFVLTAAHCVVDYDNAFKRSVISIVAGVTNAHDPNAIRIQVEKSYVLKEFQFDRINPEEETFSLTADIAVLKLYKPLGLNKPNSKVAKLEVPKIAGHYPLYENEEAVIPGFGYEGVTVEIDPLTNKEKEVVTFNKGRLKYAKTKVVPYFKCIYEFKRPVSKSHICAQVKQRGASYRDGACLGDSGGPLVYGGNQLIGVLSFGPIGCDEQNDPGIYTRVSSYAAFIQFAKSNVVTPKMRSHTYMKKK